MSGRITPAHCGRVHCVTATRLRSLLSACWPWCQRRTRSRHTPRRLLRCRWSRASSHSILTNPYQDRDMQGRWLLRPTQLDRKSTRLNSSHLGISYAVFCLKKKNSDSSVVLPPVTTVLQLLAPFGGAAA